MTRSKVLKFESWHNYSGQFSLETESHYARGVSLTKGAGDVKKPNFSRLRVISSKDFSDPISLLSLIFEKSRGILKCV